MISRSIRLFERTIEKMGAVHGASAGLGRDRVGQTRSAALDLLGADLQGFDGAIHCGLVERTRQQHTLAQLDDARKGIDDLEVRTSLPGDQQAAVVAPRRPDKDQLRAAARSRGKAAQVKKSNGQQLS